MTDPHKKWLTPWGFSHRHYWGKAQNIEFTDRVVTQHRAKCGLHYNTKDGFEETANVPVKPEKPKCSYCVQIIARRKRDKHKVGRRAG